MKAKRTNRKTVPALVYLEQSDYLSLIDQLNELKSENYKQRQEIAAMRKRILEIQSERNTNANPTN